MIRHSHLLLSVVLVLLLTGCGAKAPQQEVTEPVEMDLPAVVKIPEKFVWEKIDSTTNSTVYGDVKTTLYIDTRNTSKADGSTLTWSRVEHEKPLNIGPIHDITNELYQTTMKCGSKEISTTYWVALDADSKTLEQQKLNLQHSHEDASTQNTVAAKVFKHLCGPK